MKKPLHVGQEVTVNETPYTVAHIGPSGSGKFFGRRVVTLRDAAGVNYLTASKNGRIAWNANITPAGSSR